MAIDPAGQRILVRNLDSRAEHWQGFDQLLIATGSKGVRPSLPGIDSSNIHQVRTLAQGSRLKELLAREQPKAAVIIGGGYIGLEMAEALRLRGLATTLIQRNSQLMPTFDPDMADDIRQALVDQEVTLHLGESVKGFATRSGRVVAVVTDQRTIPADLVILGLGARPESDLAKAAGIPLGYRDSIKVNPLQQTESDTIWAAGDCCESFHLVSRRPTTIALGTVANKQGRIAGINLGGEYATFPGVLGTTITKFMDLECARTGLNEREIQALGLRYGIGMIEGRTLPRYYPGSAPIRVKVLAEKGSGRLLGTQIVGGPGSAKRIDTAAMALHANFNLDDLLYLDLSYAPPFSGVWDPIVIAARMAIKEV